MNAHRRCNGLSLGARPLVGVLLGTLLAPAACLSAQYGPEPTGPSVADIQHWTQAEYPPDHNRLDIGIRERIDLWIDPESWEDPDSEYDDQGNFVGEVQDSMGEVTWTSCPGNGVFDPPYGDSTTFEAGYATFDDCESIYVQVDDSGTLGDDYPANLYMYLGVRVPAFCVPTWWEDSEISLTGPPNKSLGAASVFFVQVEPLEVNLQRFYVREVIPAQTFQWPDGSNYDVAASQRTFALAEIPPFHNAFFDLVASGPLWSVQRLYDDAAQTYKDAYFPVVQHLLFECYESGFTEFEESLHPRWFWSGSFETEVGWGAGPTAPRTMQHKGPWRPVGQ